MNQELYNCDPFIKYAKKKTPNKSWHKYESCDGNGGRVKQSKLLSISHCAHVYQVFFVMIFFPILFSSNVPSNPK